MDLIDRLSELKSLWGILSVSTVFFPGAAYWFNIGSIKTSPLGPYYLVTAIPLGAMAVLLTLLFGENLSEKGGRIASLMLGILVVPAMMVAFVFASIDCQDSQEQSADMCQRPVTISKVQGKVITDGPSFCTCDLGGCQWGPSARTIVMNPAEYRALLFFNLCIVTLAVTFTILAGQFG
jgi:hypothetical protein